MNSQGRTLKIFVMGEHSNSLKSIELINWTGLGFFGERQHLQAIKTREELSEPGVYFLLSDNQENPLTDIYIGETDDFSRRIIDHAQSKDWWDRFIVFVSKDQNLTKAHVKFLEKELFKIAKKSISNLRVMNTQDPGGATLPESDISAMNEFMKNILFVLEALGLSYFSLENEASEKQVKPTFVLSSIEGQEFYITLSKDLSPDGKQLKSHMIFKNGIYVLKKGAYIRADAHDSFLKHDSYHRLWNQIIDSDAVQKSEGSKLLQTTRDIEFRSPSAAGAIVRARSTNGRTEWKSVNGDVPLNECELGVGESDKAA